MKKAYIFIFLLSYTIAIYYCSELSVVQQMLTKISNHTVEWCSTSLTISSILFVILSFIIPYAKANFYDTDEYKQYSQTFFGKEWEKERYRPLNNLSNCLMCAILTSLLSAGLVLFDSIFPLCTIIAVACAFLSFVTMFISLYAMKKNLDFMFKKL